MQPLCTPNSSNATGLPNTVAIPYEGVITLPPAAEWILSVEESSRPALANISAGTLRLEATLNNLITPVGGGPTVTLQNNSPQFNQLTLPVPFVCVNQSTTLTFSATDADRLNFAYAGAPGRGDSLVYSLDRPLNGCGTYETYLPYPGTGCSPAFIGAQCILRCPPNTAATYTATLPISVANDTVGMCIPGVNSTLTVQPRFLFNATAGSFRFTPNRFITGVGPAAGDNKYIIVGKVTEYRKIGGRYYKVGSVRRDFLVNVVNCLNNVLPTPPPAMAGDTLAHPTITSTFDTLQLQVRTCNYTRITVPFTDPNNAPGANQASPLQNLTVFPPVDINSNLLQNGDIGSFTITRNGTPTPQGTFYFQPSSTAINNTILITIRIEDDACPVKGIQYRTVVIKIISGQQARAVAGTGGVGIGPVPLPPPAPSTRAATICPGGYINLSGTVSRPDSVRNVASGRTVLQQYALRWEPVLGYNSAGPVVGQPVASVIGGTRTLGVRVSPATTTRYLLSITPQFGFTSGCGDTTSFLVRVAPEPVAKITLADTLTRRVCAGGHVTLQGSASRADGLRDVYTYHWQPGNGLAAADTASQNVTITAPMIAGRYTYTLTAKGQTQYGCDNTTTQVIQVVPGPTIQTRNYSPIGVCTGTPVSLKAVIFRSDNLPDSSKVQWTVAPGLNPSDVNKDTIVVRPTQTTRYRYTVTGRTRFNCNDTASVLVRVLPQPIVKATAATPYICPGGTVTLTVTTTPPPGTNDTYDYAWSGSGLVLNTGASVDAHPTVDTRYRVVATGKSQFGCSDTASVVVHIAPLAVAEFAVKDSLNASGQHTTKPPVYFTFTNTSRVATPNPANIALSGYSWTYQRDFDIQGGSLNETPVLFSTRADGIPNVAIPSNPQADPSKGLKLDQAGQYTIKLKTSASVNNQNCTDVTFVRSVAVPDNQVPNVITPNADGLNDVFKISSASTTSKLEIYNRWGRKVKEFANYDNTWGGADEAPGVYYYYITDSNGAKTKGWIEIIK